MGGERTASVTSVSRFQKLPMLDRARASEFQLLAKAEPNSDVGSNSVLTHLR